MAISVDWPTGVITVNQSDCTFVSGTFYKLNTDTFRLALKALESTDDGMAWVRTHNHNTQVTIAGVIYARTLEIINGYSVTFLPNTQWTVQLTGSNNNIWDVGGGILNQNQVQVIPGNSAGLQVVETGTSGLTPSESNALLQNTADLSNIDTNISDINIDINSINTAVLNIDSDTTTILNKITTIEVDISSIKSDIILIRTDVGVINIDIAGIKLDLAFIKAIEAGEWKIENNQMIFYDGASAEIVRFDLFNKVGVPTDEDVYRRVPV